MKSYKYVDMDIVKYIIITTDKYHYLKIWDV